MPPEYPTDLDLNESKDVHIDQTGDLVLTSGVEQLQQSVGIDVMDELRNFVGGRVTGKNIGLLEERLRQALDDDPQLDEVRKVNVREFDRRDNTIKADVIVSKDEDFEIEVTA